jgi:hypothetical protein
MTLTTNGKKRTRKDGSTVVIPRVRYTCYNRSRHPDKCDGQTGYTSTKLDEIINSVVHSLFNLLSDVPKDDVITEQYDNVIANYKKQLSAAQVSLRAHKAEVAEYEAEVIKIIRGESKLDADLLNKLHDEAKTRALNSEDAVTQLKEKIQDSKKLLESFSRQYDELETWADMYDECDMETKKMILFRIMSTVKVRREYEIEIDFTVGFEQFRGLAHSGSIQANGTFVTPQNIAS